jgi:hypothetical protein
MLRHNKITGARFVMLDAVEVPGTRGNTNLLNAVEISFKIGACVSASICVVIAGGTRAY